MEHVYRSQIDNLITGIQYSYTRVPLEYALEYMVLECTWYVHMYVPVRTNTQTWTRVDTLVCHSNLVPILGNNFGSRRYELIAVVRVVRTRVPVL